MDLFKDIIGSLNNKTGNLYEEDPETANAKDFDYHAFIINKNFSFGSDTILYANEMNKLHHLPHRLQYDFYYHGIDKRKRFNKWIKKEDINNLELVKEYYQCSTQKARQYLKILTVEDIDQIKTYLDKGGPKKTNKKK